MSTHVAVFTDSYLPTVNGISYTIRSWAERWNREYGRMDVVYPGHPDYDPAETEHPIPATDFPFYEGYRAGVPWVPEAVRSPDIIHVHSLAPVGFVGALYGRLRGLPVVATYHTPVNKYAEYIVGESPLASPLQWGLQRQERIALALADQAVVPSTDTKTYLETTIGTGTPVTVLSNGIDLQRFPPDAKADFEWAETDRPIVGYTGRHGHEKNLPLLLDAAAEMTRDPLVVFGGDGPARDSLEQQAASLDIETRFLGFLPAERLPALYSAFDVFGFPSPIETEGRVAMEAIACGTPVVGADAGAIPDTVTDGVNGHLFASGDATAFASALERALDDQQSLQSGCLDTRSDFDISTTLEKLSRLYDAVR